MKRTAIVISTIVLGVMIHGEARADAGSCDSLKALKLTDAIITSTETVAAGGFTTPGGGGAAFRDAPAFCRVNLTLQPSNDSDIKVEVWLPSAGWNGKFQAVGNGAWNGAIGYAALADALKRGYAAASTDTGHVGAGASFALGHPEKLIDFAYRSEHLMAVQGKAIVAAFYGSGPTRSYWNGCSAGGRQAFKEAQMYPADFDGIIAGSPGLDWSGRTAQAVRIAQMLQGDAMRFTPAQLKRLHNAAVEACDANDGLKDGLIANPTACTFNPIAVQCAPGGASGKDCLTPAQVDVVRAVYSPLTNAKTKREIGGLMPGSELGWTDQGWTASARATGLDHFRYVIFKDPAWDLLKFNAGTDVSKLEEGESAAVDARDPNLKPFFARGGKLLQYHGWSDPQISPLGSTKYFDSVQAALGSTVNVGNSYRLFVAPGMGHCSGGEGPNEFDKVAALEQWVEHGKAPDQIVASHRAEGKIDRTRPLCPYPQVARYKGTGSIDDAASFSCVAPR
jgi:Tannase and feruloyl esterase